MFTSIRFGLIVGCWTMDAWWAGLDSPLRIRPRPELQVGLGHAL